MRGPEVLVLSMILELLRNDGNFLSQQKVSREAWNYNGETTVSIFNQARSV